MTRSTFRTALLVLAGAALLSACIPSTTTSQPPPAAVPLQTATTTAAIPAPHTCTLHHQTGHDLPDPTCTPGTVNLAVTQDNLGTTICRVGWTATVRPPVSVTGKLKKQLDAAYGLPTTTDGELDHLISLELGGAPADPANLWIEPGAIPNPKDTVENQLHRAVCSRLIPLATAQQAIAGDWSTALATAGLQVTNSKVCLLGHPTQCATGHRGDEDGN